MNILPKTLLFLVVILLFSCAKETPKEAQEFNTLMKQTIDIHDEVMPKMSQINQQIMLLDSLKMTDSIAKKDAINQLKKSHDAMMVWMKDLSNTFTRAEINQGLQTKNSDSIQLKLEKLKSLHQDANVMKSEILSSLETAKKMQE